MRNAQSMRNAQCGMLNQWAMLNAKRSMRTQFLILNV